MAYREFQIKKKSGKHRRICAPDADFLAYQRSTLPTLAEYLLSNEAEMFGTDVFHGFIKNRNCVTAARKHIGYAHTISLDISQCFDSIYYDTLPAEVTTELEKSFVTHKDGSIAQGFATSPMLSNIYLLKPMAELVEIIEALFRRSTVTIYADDIQISVPESTYDELNLVIETAVILFQQYGLTINPRKTRIHHARFGNRRILGVQVGATAMYPNRRLRKKIRAARHQGNGPSLGGLVTSSRLLLPKALREATFS